MTWSKLGELAERGVAIGSHTLSHPHLPTLSDEDLAHQPVESRRQIAYELGRPCRFLAHPYGNKPRRTGLSCRKGGRLRGHICPSRRRRWGIRSR
jgi:peptidoglycan/xylan/chitin deacetylase (PgdA/CDA1 family)